MTLTCFWCGRICKRAYVVDADGYVRCANRAPCDRRRADQSPSAKLRRIEMWARRHVDDDAFPPGYLSRRIIAVVEGRM